MDVDKMEKKVLLYFSHAIYIVIFMSTIETFRTSRSTIYTDFSLNNLIDASIGLISLLLSRLSFFIVQIYRD